MAGTHGDPDAGVEAVDLKAGWLRLEPGETKNGEGRLFPMSPDLRAVSKRQEARTLTVERTTSTVVPWVFHRNGKPIRSLYDVWRPACQEAGIPGPLMHDSRRTAVRNLERDGVPRSTATTMTGHKTEAVDDRRRYAIVDEIMLIESGAKLQTLHSSHAPGAASSNVVGLRRE